MSTQIIFESLSAGDLTAAIAHAIQQVKANPQMLELRGMLAELFCVAGDYERADKQIETLMMQKSAFALGGKQLRQLIRAAHHREAVLYQKGIPSWIEKPNATLTHQLKALTDYLVKDYKAALKEIQKIDQAVGKIQGTVNGQSFKGFRDVDDRTALTLEVLALNGEYYWIPIQQVKQIDFKNNKEIIGMIWKPVFVTFVSGEQQHFYMPATYSVANPTETERLGLITDFTDHHGFVTARGQKIFLIGEDAISIQELMVLSFT